MLSRVGRVRIRFSGKCGVRVQMRERRNDAAVREINRLAADLSGNGVPASAAQGHADPASKRPADWNDEVRT